MASYTVHKTLEITSLWWNMLIHDGNTQDEEL